MKANLTFDLPDEQRELELAVNSAGLYSTLECLMKKIDMAIDKEDVPNQKKQVYTEIGNLLRDELEANRIKNLFY